VAIMRQGQLMHVEDMRNRKGLRLILVKYCGEPPEGCPDELELTLKCREGNVDLFEHRGEVGPLLAWLQSCNVVDLAIGTEDLKSLYEQFHGTGTPDLEVILK
jgi:ABC-2 type transport system ATP-binding protein